ncbi:hypothetical protein LFL96_25995 [Paraburkholderia sp. D15]|uniref:hypothetical protein n=1 Tax=Paraburkholderia sp. D15 TaxID=2880218 RepID=UPI002479995E|nr:hypothetical protein [Paraburkholderia sp. D15]WGS54469.1 hypothetical protein LFL96_25995 [Paraburkholderia sp. D15]
MDKRLHELTDLAIAELEDEVGVQNLRMAIRENFDDWTMRLFPLLQARKKGCYPYVADLLKRAGYENATENLVRTYFWQIREARRSAKANQTPSLPPQTAPVASPAPMPSSPMREAEKVFVAPQPVSSFKNASSPAVVPRVLSGEPIEPDWNWHEQSQRLELEGEGDYKGIGWTELDERMYRYFLQLAEDNGIPDLYSHVPAMNKQLRSDVSRSTLRNLKNKRAAFSLPR